MRRKNRETILMFSKARVATISFVVMMVFCAIIGRLYYLHVIRSDKSIVETDKARHRVDILKSKRGNITDANKNLVAISSPIITIAVDSETFKYQLGKDNNIPLKKIAKMTVAEMRQYKPSQETVEKLEKIASILNISYDELYAKCVAGGKWHKLAVIEDEAKYTEIRNCKVKAIYGNRKYVRKYPSGSLLSHIVGFVNKDFVPVMGVERQFEFYLRGQDGRIETERDGGRSERPEFRTRQIDPLDGLNIELSIDLVVQEIVQRQMSKIAAVYKPQKAAIIVSEPSTGYILGMASYPNFDPNNYSKYGDKETLNYAISGLYEPGSTFKIIPISGALNESLVGPDDVFDCSVGAMNYRGKNLRLPKDDHPIKKGSVRDIIKKSSNRGSAVIGGILGGERLVEYAKAFGYGKKTEIRLSGEINGIVHPVNKWDGLTITRMPIGHAVSATPLQTHCAMSVIANQGIYMQPQLVKRIYDNKGQTIINYSPQAIRRVISPKVATLMSEMLAEVPTSTGTARRAAIKGFKVAGKTGTSQKIVQRTVIRKDGKKVVKNEYSNKNHIASFTGFFPANRPRLVITVVVDDAKVTTGRRIAYGGLVAAPAFKEIGEEIAAYLGIQSDEDFEKTVAWKTTLHESL
ncbi:MAG: penicillin-binding protein 2 [Verrucomicrobiaceae bacterium]|nr:penicillin-binding protein 2 [Verrucomicrobiaceae bacterium]